MNEELELEQMPQTLGKGLFGLCDDVIVPIPENAAEAQEMPLPTESEGGEL